MDREVFRVACPVLLYTHILQTPPPSPSPGGRGWGWDIFASNAAINGRPMGHLFFFVVTYNICSYSNAGLYCAWVVEVLPNLELIGAWMKLVHVGWPWGDETERVNCQVDMRLKFNTGLEKRCLVESWESVLGFAQRAVELSKAKVTGVGIYFSSSSHLESILPTRRQT